MDKSTSPWAKAEELKHWRQQWRNQYVRGIVTPSQSVNWISRQHMFKGDETFNTNKPENALYMPKAICTVQNTERCVCVYVLLRKAQV